jgi:hypothetical protein
VTVRRSAKSTCRNRGRQTRRSSTVKAIGYLYPKCPRNKPAVQTHQDAELPNHALHRWFPGITNHIPTRRHTQLTTKVSQPAQASPVVARRIPSRFYHAANTPTNRPTPFHRTTPPSTGESDAYSTIHSRVDSPPISHFLRFQRRKRRDPTREKPSKNFLRS